MRRPRLSYANVISSLALFIALGGTGYAVTKLPRNSVGNTQLKANAVSSGKIRPGGVQVSDLAPAARPGSGGTRGPRGPGGPAGPKGDTGPSEIIQVRRTESVNVPSGGGGSVTLASVTLEPGSWELEAQTTAFYSPPAAGSEFIDCALQTATDTLGSGLSRIGTDAAGTQAGVIPIRGAVTFAAATEVHFVCAHPSPIAAEPSLDRTVLIARRVGSLANR